MDAAAKIYIAGHRGMVGSAILRRLQEKGYEKLVLKSRQELDLTDQDQVTEFFREEKPEYVFLAAAKVGGILANATDPADFIYQNLAIQTNVIHQSYLNGVKKLLFLGSSCIYPRSAEQPMKEEYLLTGLLESTNEAYAIAKIAGIKMCQAYNIQHNTNYISVMPTNLYGPYDNFDLETSHVLPALIRKFHEAKKNRFQYVELWGSGKPKREFLYVDDLADACIFLMKNYNSSEIINIGTGKDLSIRELSAMIGEIVDFKGDIRWDSSKPDGAPRKLLDVSRLKSLGWKAGTGLREGIDRAYRWYVDNIN